MGYVAPMLLPPNAYDPCVVIILLLFALPQMADSECRTASLLLLLSPQDLVQSSHSEYLLNEEGDEGWVFSTSSF